MVYHNTFSLQPLGQCTPLLGPIIAQTGPGPRQLGHHQLIRWNLLQRLPQIRNCKLVVFQRVVRLSPPEQRLGVGRVDGECGVAGKDDVFVVGFFEQGRGQVERVCQLELFQPGAVFDLADLVVEEVVVAFGFFVPPAGVHPLFVLVEVISGLFDGTELVEHFGDLEDGGAS